MCRGGERGEFAPHCQKLMVARYPRERERRGPSHQSKYVLSNIHQSFDQGAEPSLQAIMQRFKSRQNKVL